MRDEANSTPSDPTRREFFWTTGGTVAAAVIAGCAPAHRGVSEQPEAPSASNQPSIEGAVNVKLRINGRDHALRVDPRTTLLDCLRENLALTGTKKGATTDNAVHAPST